MYLWALADAVTYMLLGFRIPDSDRQSRPKTHRGKGTVSQAAEGSSTVLESGTAPEDRRFRPDVEGLRAVAIILVVLFHVGIPQARGGFVGVDVFFVISGFVITGLLLRQQAGGRVEFLTFYSRRALRRILPMALLVIVVSTIAVAVVANRSLAVETASDGRWSAVFLANFHLFDVTPSVIGVRPSSPFQQFWSLAIEDARSIWCTQLSSLGCWPSHDGRSGLASRWEFPSS